VAQSPADFQELQRLAALYEQYDRAGQFQQAFEVAQKNLAFVQQRRFIREIELAAFESMARSQQNLGRFREALPYYNEIIEGAGSVRPPTNDLRILVIKMKGNALRFAGGCHERLHELDEALARYRQAVGFFEGQGFAVEAAETRTGLGWTLQALERNEESLSEFNAALKVLVPAARQERPADHIHDNWANALLGISWVHERAGRYDLAEPPKRQALNVITQARGWNNPRAAIVIASLADLYFRQGRYVEAEPFYLAAFDAYKATVGLNHVDALSALNNFGRMLAVQERYAHAETIIRDVVEQRRATNDLDLVVSLVNLANVLNAQDKNAEAEPLAREALALAEQLFGPISDKVADPLRVLAGIKLALGDNEQSLALCDRGLAIYEKSPVAPGYEGQLYALRGYSLWELGRKSEAFEAMRKAIEGAELQRAYFGGAEHERAVGFGGYRSAYDALLSWHAEEDNMAGMFTMIETLKARSFVDELQIGMADLLQGIPPAERERLASQEQQLRGRLTDAEATYNRLADSREYSSPEMTDTLRQAARAVLDARQALYEHMAEVRAASPMYRQLLTSESQTLSLDSAQQELLETGSLLLSYRLGGEESHLLIVSRDSARFVKLEITENQALILQVDPGPLTDRKLSAVLLGEGQVLALLSRPKSQEDYFGRLAVLWEVLIPERERKTLIGGEVQQLIVLPDGPLALMPFEALVTGTPRSPRYLLDVGPPILYGPSASVLLNLAHRAPRHDFAKERVLTLGDPAYPTTEVPLDAVANRLGVRSSSERLRGRLSRLPHSGHEARWVEEHFAKHGVASVRLTADQATEGKLRTLARQREIVHLACHGMADANYGNFFGCLAVAAGNPRDPNDDGILYSSEIRGLPLAGCELAILSACETNYGPHQTGEGVWNLSRAFLVAGARRIIASNWVVDDRAGATLVSYFAAELAKAGTDASARDYAKALQRAKRQVRNQEKWKHPFYWSSLVLVGPR